jgi:hypothetical protein
MNLKSAQIARVVSAALAAAGLATAARWRRRLGHGDGWFELEERPDAPVVAARRPPPVPDPPDQERSQAPLTDDHLAHLATFVTRAHQEMTERRPELGDTLVAGVLAQGAAAHRLDPSAGVGVKDLDVWLFYARRDGVRPVNPRALAAVYDFGASALGRHPEDPARFAGRRVDVLTRTIDADGMDPADAVRTWLAGRNPSPQRLRERPVILLWPVARCCEVVWAGPPT